MTREKSVVGADSGHDGLRADVTSVDEAIARREPTSATPPDDRKREEQSMLSVKKWSVDVFIWEGDDGETSAEARLVAEDRAKAVVGRGAARLNPHDADVPEIGDEVAVGRALSDLGRNLMSTAEADVEAMSSDS
jgi:hypothetical protein